MTENKFSISTSGLVISCALSLLVGIGGTVFYYHPSAVHAESHDAAQETASDSWIKLSTGNSADVLTYSSDAMFKSDIKLPAIKSFSGKAKFVTELTNQRPQTKLGYVVDVDITPLDAPKAPDSYKKDNEGNADTKKTPLANVDYDVVFYFILKDKDGFPLMKAASNTETVHSGANNHFQFFAKGNIPQAIASNTKMITARIEAVKCLTCQHDEEDTPPSRHKRRGLFNF